MRFPSFALRCLLVALLGLSVARAAGPPSVDSPLRLTGGGSKDAAILIGNEAYAALPQATYAGFDVRAFQTFAEGIGISKSRITFLENARAAVMTEAIKKGVARVRKGGTLWIYFSGYGAFLNNQRLLLGVDATPDNLASTGIPLDMALAAAAKTRATRIIVIVDAGFGGVGRDGLALVPGKGWPAPTAPPSVPKNALVWLADGTSRTVAGYGDGRHGLFTWLVLGALRGWADGALGERDGSVTVGEAQHYVLWSGRRMGRPMVSTEDSRPDIRNWLLSRGQLEKGPSAEALAELGTADRARRFAIAEERLRAEAAAFWQATAARASAGGEDGRSALQAFIDEYSMPVMSIEWSVFIPEVLEARRALDNYGKAPPVASAQPEGGGQEPQPDDVAESPAPTPTAVLAAAAVTEGCDDLVGMEGQALLGQLSSGQISCLQGRLATARVQTARNKISRTLLVDAQTKGDIPQWEALMRRHLEEIDRSDPALCMLYAIHLHKKGVEYAEEAIYWAGYALENKQVWVGDEYVKRVYGLYRLRSEAAAGLWRAAELAYQADPSDENEAISAEYRGLAKDFAREWLDYGRAAGQDTRNALELCRSAAGSDEFCRAQ